MATVDELFDALMKSCKKPGDLFGEDGLLKQFSRKSPDRTLPSVMKDDSGYRIYPQRNF